MAVPITFENVGFTYQPNTPFEVKVLENINLSLPEGKVTAIIGHTGSGKSTLIQHLNVLLKPTKGKVWIDGREISANSDNKQLKSLRKKIGVVFQFPESQLFEETIIKDVMFGPMNFGIEEEEAERIAKEKLALVGIDEELFERSPFDLSGGQMRRVAIAGVLALEPEVLVLDEPTAGLDPKGQFQMLEMFMELQRKKGLTLVLVTHQMDDVAQYADQVVVMEKGQIVKQGKPIEIFADPTWLKEKQLGLPTTLEFLEQLNSALPYDLYQYIEEIPLTVNQLSASIFKLSKLPKV
ncbi:energy-coupling factor ABC transporter ATP-binding protein [Facklamia sp. DSM 111018]|uniref:Energy-coupling factor transporter ATP-binding protein EcfA2 n=1 Tax=Facklamia lactis TaxID=2749967 RepID=A0ABS0LQT3_9LACT|nr:energy-coupling factor ABC transporter ATP-binding protein [Facklamia lactis]MBG9980624.1 energy-coupling factor ABC transporter ATP-binding protein [Facklamia lactis]MBG9986438.1 energy-coupling factor ABC transporter ATP-binding protein [Facklamia lactis]